MDRKKKRRRGLEKVFGLYLKKYNKKYFSPLAF